MAAVAAMLPEIVAARTRRVAAPVCRRFFARVFRCLRLTIYSIDETGRTYPADAAESKGADYP
jgi:hypothetical protein